MTTWVHLPDNLVITAGRAGSVLYPGRLVTFLSVLRTCREQMQSFARISVFPFDGRTAEWSCAVNCPHLPPVLLVHALISARAGAPLPICVVIDSSQGYSHAEITADRICS
ncbi:hypothetical protein Bbelb_138850 [Branchiostoma belcheri]|nr:hypothetical protein Bbelb_138850 [Branchiostoma belcheri]